MWAASDGDGDGAAHKRTSPCIQRRVGGLGRLEADNASRAVYPRMDHLLGHHLAQEAFRGLLMTPTNITRKRSGVREGGGEGGGRP